MKAGVTFQGDCFAPVPGEEDETNPGRCGKALALWPAAALGKDGGSVEAVRAEDFGWIVVVARRPLLLWLGCGNVDGGGDPWHIFPVAEPSLGRRIFHRRETETALQTLWKQARSWYRKSRESGMSPGSKPSSRLLLRSLRRGGVFHHRGNRPPATGNFSLFPRDYSSLT